MRVDKQASTSIRQMTLNLQIQPYSWITQKLRQRASGADSGMLRFVPLCLSWQCIGSLLPLAFCPLGLCMVHQMVQEPLVCKAISKIHVWAYFLTWKTLCRTTMQLSLSCQSMLHVATYMARLLWLGCPFSKLYVQGKLKSKHRTFSKHFAPICTSSFELYPSCCEKGSRSLHNNLQLTVATDLLLE